MLGVKIHSAGARTRTSTGRANIVVAAMLAFSCAASIAVPPAFGCAYHAVPEVRLEGIYPGSLSVAVAVRRAADRGVIDAAALETPRRHVALYNIAVRRLHEFGNVLAASPAAADLPASFSLGYVGSRLWTRYSRRSDGKIRVNAHTDGPAEGEAVVLTGEPVLTEVLAGRLSVERALAIGMILIDGDEGERTAIRRVLDATPVAPRISSR